MLEYSELKVFVSVAKHLNFSKAGQEVGLSASQITKIIANLESKIHCKLLHRTTRNARLTAEGHTFLSAATKNINSINETMQLFESNINPAEMSGVIRITAAHTLGSRVLQRPLQKFSENYPQVQIQVLLDDRYLDFTEHEIDIALRVMKPVDSPLIAKKVGSNPVSFYASPEWLKKNGMPRSIHDLPLHTVYCIPQHSLLLFEKAQIPLQQFIKKQPLQCSNGDFIVEMACQGQGILVRSEWGAKREVNQGRLVRLELDDQLKSETGVYLVYPKHKHTPFRVKACIDVLAKTLGKEF